MKFLEHGEASSSIVKLLRLAAVFKNLKTGKTFA
jgi:hypothetical protein